MSAVSEILKDIKIPKMVRFEQQFFKEKLDNVEEEVRFQMNQPFVKMCIRDRNYRFPWNYKWGEFCSMVYNCSFCMCFSRCI